jgi:hypothetical protein
MPSRRLLQHAALMHAPGTLGRLVSISTGARPHLGPEVGGADVLAHGHPAGAQVVVLSKQLQAPPAARARRAGRAACGVSAARWAGHQPRPRAPASAVGGPPAQTKGTSQRGGRDTSPNQGHQPAGHAPAIAQPLDDLVHLLRFAGAACSHAQASQPGAGGATARSAPARPAALASRQAAQARDEGSTRLPVPGGKRSY